MKPQYYEDGLRLDYWDLTKHLWTLKKKDGDCRPTLVRCRKRTMAAMVEAGNGKGEDPGKGPLRR